MHPFLHVDQRNVVLPDSIQSKQTAPDRTTFLSKSLRHRGHGGRDHTPLCASVVLRFGTRTLGKGTPKNRYWLIIERFPRGFVRCSKSIRGSVRGGRPGTEDGQLGRELLRCRHRSLADGKAWQRPLDNESDDPAAPRPADWSNR